MIFTKQFCEKLWITLRDVLGELGFKYLQIRFISILINQIYAQFIITF